MFTIEMTAVQLVAQWLLTVMGTGAIVAWVAFGLTKLFKAAKKEMSNN